MAIRADCITVGECKWHRATPMPQGLRGVWALCPLLCSSVAHCAQRCGVLCVHRLPGGTKMNSLGKIHCDPGWLQWYTDDILLFAILVWANSCYWNVLKQNRLREMVASAVRCSSTFFIPPCLNTVSLTYKMKIIKNILLKASECISEMMCAECLAYTKCPIGYHLFVFFSTESLLTIASFFLGHHGAMNQQHMLPSQAFQMRRSLPPDDIQDDFDWDSIV